MDTTLKEAVMDIPRIPVKRESRRFGRVLKPEGDLVVGEMNLALGVFQEALLECVRKESSNYAIDLENVTNIDDVGFRFLIAFVKMVNHKYPASGVEVINCQPDVARLLQAKRLDRRSGVKISMKDYVNDVAATNIKRHLLRLGWNRVDREFDAMIREERIRPFFQPIVDLFSQKIIGYEILSRGDPPFESPMEMFIKAEQMGLTWDLEYACRSVALRKIGQFLDILRDSYFFINVSPDIFGDSRFAEGFTLNAMGKYGINRKQVVMEITEEAAFSDYGKMESIARHYVNQGFHIALDDFGSGHSSMAKLISIAPEFIKVDSIIVRDVHKNTYKQMLIKSMVSFADGVESKIIAEGVETWEEMECLLRHGVRYAQGFLLGRPLPLPMPLAPAISENIRLRVDKYNTPQADLDETIQNMVINTTTVPSGRMKCEELDQLFKDSPKLDHVVIIDKARNAQGLITRQGFYTETGGQFGYTLFQKKPVEELTRPDCLVVKEKTAVTVLAKIAMERTTENIYDPVIVSDDEGNCIGTVTIKRLLQRAGELEIDTAIGANPLTKLPGNRVIQRWIMDISREHEFSLVYADLNSFKEYNDSYGFLQGDDIIRLQAQSMCDELPELGGSAKVGHIGGDDFIMVLNSKIPEKNLQNICERFDEGRLRHFNEQDIAQGFYASVNRNGEQVKVPLVSVSLSVITSDSLNYPPHPALLSQIAASLKKRIKKQCAATGASGYLIERRTYE